MQIVGEIEDGQTVVPRRLGRLLTRGAPALDDGKVARVGLGRRRGRRWLGRGLRERRGRRTGDQSQEQTNEGSRGKPSERIRPEEADHPAHEQSGQEQEPAEEDEKLAQIAHRDAALI